MNLLTLLGLQFPSKQLSTEALAILRVIQSIFIGALTTAVVTGITFLTTSSGAVTLTAAVVMVIKTFVDAFGHGIAKYVREAGQPGIADKIDTETTNIEGKIPDEFRDPNSTVGPLPPQPPRG
jgi:hypothetical protein